MHCLLVIGVVVLVVLPSTVHQCVLATVHCPYSQECVAAYAASLFDCLAKQHVVRGGWCDRAYSA